MKKWITNKHIGSRCPTCGKNTAVVEKATNTSTGRQRRILKCYNPRCRYETR